MGGRFHQWTELGNCFSYKNDSLLVLSEEMQNILSPKYYVFLNIVNMCLMKVVRKQYDSWDNSMDKMPASQDKV